MTRRFGPVTWSEIRSRLCFEATVSVSRARAVVSFNMTGVTSQSYFLLDWLKKTKNTRTIVNQQSSTDLKLFTGYGLAQEGREYKNYCISAKCQCFEAISRIWTGSRRACRCGRAGTVSAGWTRRESARASCSHRTRFASSPSGSSCSSPLKGRLN